MEEDENEKLRELIEIEELATKIEELSKLVKDIKGRLKEGTKSIVDKKVIAEKEIKEKPFIYIMGAFVGGIIIGYMAKRKQN